MFRAAQLRDPRNLAAAEKRMEEQRKAGPGRPPMEHHDTVVEALLSVGDDIRTLIGVMSGGAEVPMHPRPAGPADIIADRRKQIALAKNAEATG